MEHWRVRIYSKQAQHVIKFKHKERVSKHEQLSAIFTMSSKNADGRLHLTVVTKTLFFFNSSPFLLLTNSNLTCVFCSDELPRGFCASLCSTKGRYCQKLLWFPGRNLSVLDLLFWRMCDGTQIFCGKWLFYFLILLFFLFFCLNWCYNISRYFAGNGCFIYFLVIFSFFLVSYIINRCYNISRILFQMHWNILSIYPFL